MHQNTLPPVLRTYSLNEGELHVLVCSLSFSSKHHMQKLKPANDNMYRPPSLSLKNKFIPKNLLCYGAALKNFKPALSIVRANNFSWWMLRDSNS